MKITALEPQTRNAGRYNLYLDGRFASALAGSLILDLGLVVGQELSASEFQQLQSRAEEGDLFERALRFLAPRPRSRAEVRRRLLAPRRGHPAPHPDLVERVLDHLEGLELQDDQQFAAFWVENRERFSPRSARALAFELRQRGVAREIIEQADAPDRDEERALAAGRQRLHALSHLRYEAFRTRLGQFLLRRGFSYGVAGRVARQLWEESGGSEGSDDSSDSSEY